MNSPPLARPVLSLPCAALSAMSLALLLPGCVIQNIHDRMEETSVEMAQANLNLERVTAQLEQANSTLDRRLAEIAVTNEHLRQTRARLEILDDIQHELGALDLHLASLRRTLDNIDSVIPLLNLADPATDPAGEPSSAEPGEPPVTPPGAGPASGIPGPASAPSDAPPGGPLPGSEPKAGTRGTG